jgi:hypothetical protein
MSLFWLRKVQPWLALQKPPLYILPNNHRLLAGSFARSCSRITKGRQEEPAGENAGPYLAHAKCRQHWATGGNVGLHEGLECLNDAMNCLQRFKSEAVGEFLCTVGFPAWA